MAGRTGASVGVAITITILGFLSLGLFVLSMVFYGNMTKAQKDYVELSESGEDFVRGNERDQRDVRRALDQAQEARESVVMHLLTSLNESMRMAAGPENAESTPVDLRNLMVEAGLDESESLIGALRDRDSTISNLESSLAQAESARQQALLDLSAESDRVAQIESDFNAQGGSLDAEVGEMRTDLLGVRGTVDSLEQRMRDDVTQIQSTAGETQSQMRSTISEQRTEIAVLRDQIRRLRGEGPADRPQGLPEEALVDGTVSAINDADGEVTLSIGRNQKVILGMTFSVYSDATEIRPDPISGRYPRGKASLEVIEIEAEFCRARILRASRGNPIARGDVVANPVFDPNKTYRFVVFGNFDIDGNGVPTPLERDDLQAIIERWGGVVQDEITGDLDFVVLGFKPALGPPPPSGSPTEVVEEYLRRQRVVERYDELLEAAQTTAIPVLNENRLRTLMGEIPF